LIKATHHRNAEAQKHPGMLHYAGIGGPKDRAQIAEARAPAPGSQAAYHLEDYYCH
jgi:hypothetical protein